MYIYIDIYISSRFHSLNVRVGCEEEMYVGAYVAARHLRDSETSRLRTRTALGPHGTCLLLGA